MTTRAAQRGFTYLAALFIIAFMGVAAMATGTMWHTANMRERETELLHVGNAYRKAIERYYLASAQRRYPPSLEAMLKDARQPATQRYLRRLYPDPITGSSEWGIVKGPDGGVMGVYSKSEDVPLKRTGFRLRDRDLEAAKTYADWKFIYTPTQRAVKPPATPTPGGAQQPQPAQPATPPAPTAAPAVRGR